MLSITLVLEDVVNYSQLKYFLSYLVNNSIGIEGCRELVNSEWRNLKTINLSTLHLMKAITSLATMNALKC